MFGRSFKTKAVLMAACLVIAAAVTVPLSTRPSAADDLTGRELLSVTRVAQGGADYAGLQYVTARSEGFVNMASFAAAGAAALAGAVEVKLKITDYQDNNLRRRLDVAPTGGMFAGPTFLVYTGTEGGGQISGNEFRVTEQAGSRHWGMMGFATLNKAIDGQLVAVRQRDEGNNYVVEVKFTPQDTLRYYIDKNSFLINRVTTRYNSRPLVEVDRSDYRRVGCMMLPFHVVTRWNGQRLADLQITGYDVQTVVPTSRFTMTATP
jgi:hypothetical protein